jgi:hypothetical protein
MQTTYKTPWPSVLLLILSGFFSTTFIGIGLLMGIAGLLEIFSGNAETAESSLTLSAGSVFLGLALIPSGYFSFMHILNKQAKPLPLHRIPTWSIVTVWIVSASLTALLDNVATIPLVSIPLNLVTLVLPIWILIRIALRGLDSGSPELRWGTFTVGMTVVPLLIGFAEVMVILAAGIAAIFWIAINPDLISAVESLSARLMYTNNPDAITRILAPYIFNPVVIGAGLIFFSVIIPIIEELLKPLGVWLSPNRLMTAKQGFAIGVLGGAAYALVESLGISPGIPEASNLLSIVRAGTDLVHVVTTGLMGWALVSAWREKKYIQLGITYLLVIVIHGIWNTLALSSAAQIAIDYLPNPSIWVQNLPLVSAIGLGVLSIINLSILLVINKRLNSTTMSIGKLTSLEE